MATTNAKSTPASRSKKLSDAEIANDFMGELDHPLKVEIEAVRAIIKGANSTVSERIKWGAPSYFTSVDLVTFNLRMATKVHLVFHNEAITKVKSDLLLGDYKDRRMMYFDTMKTVEANKTELERIIKEYVALVG